MLGSTCTGFKNVVSSYGTRSIFERSSLVSFPFLGTRLAWRLGRPAASIGIRYSILSVLIKSPHVLLSGLILCSYRLKFRIEKMRMDYKPTISSSKFKPVGLICVIMRPGSRRAQLLLILKPTSSNESSSVDIQKGPQYREKERHRSSRSQKG